MTTPKAVKSEWTIQLRDLRAARSGYRIGPFGLHKLPRGGWSVDHIPSGYRVSQLDAPTLDKAKRNVAAALSLPIDWDACTSSDAIRREFDRHGGGYEVKRMLLDAIAAAEAQP